MFKAKVISENNCPDLESEINNWLKDKENIEIVSTNQTEGPGLDKDTELPSITVTIFYKDNEHNIDPYFEKK